MSFIDRLIDPRQPYKKQKTFTQSYQASEMAYFAQRPSNQYLNAPTAPSRKRSQQFNLKRDDVDDFLSSDLELSFASTVSLNSPPRPDPIDLTPDSDYAEPMDISPAPVQKVAASRALYDRTSSLKPLSRPRAFTSAARLFGNDISNATAPSPPQLAPAALIKSGSTQSSSKRLQRAALPSGWLSSLRAAEPLPTDEPTTPTDDAMDVDTSFIAEPQAPVSSWSPAPLSAAPTITSFHAPLSAAPTITSFNNLFYETMSPPRRSYDSPSGPHKKRRSLSPEPQRIMNHGNCSSPMLSSSPSQEKEERVIAGVPSSRSKPSLQGLGAPSSNFLKRPRRPALSAMVHPSEAQAIQSAYPVLASGGQSGSSGHLKGAPPVRRAFSALIAPSMMEPSSDESSFDGPDMSSPAQAYAKRQQVRTIRRCDGTDDFRPLTGASALVLKESPSAKFMAAGMPGFGDNEAHGKVLPCHRVTEDGLMRIKPETLDVLLDGKYADQIADFHVIDCRFDYEYAGGHIPGAVNINTTAAVEELLLGPSLTKPRPSTSGDATRKTILVFHCEFSAKRAPTFAKHLRAKDRAMNNHVYPRIHYPEVYILEGGYCQYFKVSGKRCQPSAYVTMDDPTHALSRREDLDQFRKAKFGRHKSYAYGDGAGKTSLLSQAQQAKRNTAPSGGPNPLFAAANAARTRRGGGSGALSTLPEDGNVTADADDTDTDIGDSPCPPPTKATAFKGKKIGRAPLARAETYNPVRMAY